MHKLGSAFASATNLVEAALGRATRVWERLRDEWAWVDSPRTAWRFVHWLGSAPVRRLRRRITARGPTSVTPVAAPAAPPGTSASPPWTEYPLGLEIAALGVRSQAVFRASSQVAPALSGQHVDVVLVDTAAEAVGVSTPVLVLDEAPPLLSVPAFDSRVDNPSGWRRRVGRRVGALGPLDRLPPTCRANRVVRRDDREALRRLHHLEDVRAFHADDVTRAGELARLAALGVVVHLADEDRRLAPYLGEELFALMTGAVRDLDPGAREALSVRMRRAALREHSLSSRARQVAARVLADPPQLPLVSVLLPTRRPALLQRALAAVRRQSYPRLELVLALHGGDFGEVAADAAGPSTPLTVLRLDAALSLGSVLNAATQAARGTLLAKMDDDDLYGSEHVWDLVLAQEYSQAPLVGKGPEYVYLAASNRTVRRGIRRSELFGSAFIAGGALLVTRQVLERVGGWKRLPGTGTDQALVHAVRQVESIYRTHPRGFVLVRHGDIHTWDADDAWFLEKADVNKAGWRPELAGVVELQPPPWQGAASDRRARDFAKLARSTCDRLGQTDAHGDRTGALDKLAGELAVAAPAAPQRAVAGDLREALSNRDFDRARRMTTTAQRLPDLNASKIISRKYGFLWLGVPGAAAQRLNARLRELDPEAEVSTRQSIAEVYARYPEVRSYYSFAFVRDPYRRALSFYRDEYRRQGSKHQWFDTYYGALPAFSFADLCPVAGHPVRVGCVRRPPLAVPVATDSAGRWAVAGFRWPLPPP